MATDPTCQYCGQPCSMDNNDGHGWFCNCVMPCPHADQGTGWYISTRRELVTESVEALYYVWADSPADAVVRLNDPNKQKYTTERVIQQTIQRFVAPQSDWSPPSYDYNEGMGR